MQCTSPKSGDSVLMWTETTRFDQYNDTFQKITSQNSCCSTDDNIFAQKCQIPLDQIHYVFCQLENTIMLFVVKSTTNSMEWYMTNN